MQTYSEQQAHDKYCPPSRSNINIDKMESDLGLDSFCLTKLYADFILCEYVDINEDGIEKDGEFFVHKTVNNTWRKARVLLIADAIRNSCQEKEGDIVIFPSDKGLKTGSVQYKDPQNGEVKMAKYGLFINEPRIFGKVEEIG